MTDDERAPRASRSVYGSQEESTPARSRQPFLGRIAYRTLWIPIWCMVKLVFRLRVEGKERFPDGPFILSPIHRSFIDTPVAGMITSRRLRFMGKESLWDSRLLGAFLSVMGGFPVERGAVDRTALRAAEDYLQTQ